MVKQIGWATMLFLSSAALGQVKPGPSARLNFTQVMFEHEVVKNASVYVIQIVDSTNADFSKPLIEHRDSSVAAVIGGFQFGKKYQWRYSGKNDKGLMGWKGPYNFEILNDQLVNPNSFRTRIVKNEFRKYEPGIIIADYARSAINRNGEYVWFLPNIKDRFDQNASPRDLRLTQYGTVTFLVDKYALECDLGGNIIWQAPNTGDVSGDSTEYYHHDFRHLPNANYMVLSSRNIWKPIPAYYDISNSSNKYPIEERNGKNFAKIEYGTIIEYNPGGKVVWSWNSENYFKDEDLFLYHTGSGLPCRQEENPHLNAFSVDSSNQYVYAGFKNISRIIKISKATGKVVNSWGDKMASGETREGQGFIYKQHDSNILNDNSIAVFNNDDPAANVPSSAVIFSQPSGGKPSEVKWKYDCFFDSIVTSKSVKGGNVDELKNGDLLICMGTINRIFEVSRKKEIVWNALIEHKESEEWKPFQLFRAHFMSSLYPCYFTVEMKDCYEQGTCSIKIFNVGTEDDSYEIRISSVSGVNQAINSAIVPAGSSVQIPVTIDPKIYSGKAEVRVSSHTNPALQRMANLVSP